MRQGEPSDSMHVILSGEVDVLRGHPSLTEPVVFATLGPGELAGEIGVLDGGPRTATVVATRTTRTLELSVEQVAELILRYPEATTMLLRTVSGRLRTTDELAERLARKTGEGEGGDRGVRDR
jgi:CRP/FNR family transcriptional regulator, cyclic AMP receptor protein